MFVCNREYAKALRQNGFLDQDLFFCCSAYSITNLGNRVNIHGVSFSSDKLLLVLQPKRGEFPDDFNKYVENIQDMTICCMKSGSSDITKYKLSNIKCVESEDCINTLISGTKNRSLVTERTRKTDVYMCDYTTQLEG